MVERSDLLRQLAPTHLGHVEVCDDQGKVMPLGLPILNFLQCFHSCEGGVQIKIHVETIDHGGGRFYVEEEIINQKNPLPPLFGLLLFEGDGL